MRDDADSTTGGRLFQARGAATGNDRSPKVNLLTGGTMRAGAPARFQARVGKDFWRKFGAKRRNFFEFAHPGVQFVHPGFNSMGGQRPSCGYLNYLNKSSLLPSRSAYPLRISLSV